MDQCMRPPPSPGSPQGHGEALQVFLIRTSRPGGRSCTGEPLSAEGRAWRAQLRRPLTPGRSWVCTLPCSAGVLSPAGSGPAQAQDLEEACLGCSTAVDQEQPPLRSMAQGKESEQNHRGQRAGGRDGDLNLEFHCRNFSC